MAHEPGPDTLAARTELADLIAEAAGGLSDRDRSVLELAYRHGLDGPELAEALGFTGFVRPSSTPLALSWFPATPATPPTGVPTWRGSSMGGTDGSAS